MPKWESVKNTGAWSDGSILFYRYDDAPYTVEVRRRDTKDWRYEVYHHAHQLGKTLRGLGRAASLREAQAAAVASLKDIKQGA